MHELWLRMDRGRFLLTPLVTKGMFTCFTESYSAHENHSEAEF
jgi:hypothetical protein